MSRPFRLMVARRSAEAFLNEEGLTTLPVDPFAIAASRDIEVEAKPGTEEGVSGMLLRHGNQFGGNLYATQIQNKGFQRFSVSHELGHYFLEGHIDQLLKEGVHISHAGFVTADPYEVEADHFAAGLLMPKFHSAKQWTLSNLALPVLRHWLTNASLRAPRPRYVSLN